MGKYCEYCGMLTRYSHDCFSYDKKRLYCSNCGAYIGEYSSIPHTCYGI